MSEVRPAVAFGGTVSALIENPLYMPGKDPQMAPAKIAVGQKLQHGSVLGRVTATEELVLSVATATDGSEVPRAILVEDLDTTADTVAKTFAVAVGGFFNETALTYGAGHDAWSVRVPLAKFGIYMSAPRYSHED